MNEKFVLALGYFFIALIMVFTVIGVVNAFVDSLQSRYGKALKEKQKQWELLFDKFDRFLLMVANQYEIDREELFKLQREVIYGDKK